MQIIRSFLVISLLVSFAGCTPYKKYQKPQSQKSDQACGPALTAYTDLIKPLVEDRCIKCHVQGGSASLAASFEAGNATHNMLAFSKLKNGDPEAIFNKASDPKNHGGGQQLEAGDKEKLTQFFGSLALCQTPLTEGPPQALCKGDALPRRVNLLTRTEYKNSVQAVSGVNVEVNIPAAATILDGNKNPRLAFSNDQKSRSVDPNAAFNVKTAAETIARDFAPAKREALACTGDAPSDLCIQNLGAAVYRRPLAAEELTDLRGLGNFTLLVTFLFQSPDFLYRTEMGDEQSGSNMSSYEIASALSFTLTGMPPDQELLKLAQQGLLADSATRRAQADRLLKLAVNADQPVQQFFNEWLELGNSKSANKVGTYDGPAVFAEAQAFLKKAIWDNQGSLNSLFTQVEGERKGILEQKAFLASHSNNNSTSPVKLGKTVARNMLCLALPPPPANVKTDLVESPENKTTRSKLEAHTKNPSCASCHARIDPFGLAFGGFDQLGLTRTEDNGEAVDTRVEVKLGLSFDQNYEGSSVLLDKVSNSPELAQCFDSFFQQYAYGSLSCESQKLSPTTSIREYILNLVGSDRFIIRNAVL